MIIVKYNGGLGNQIFQYVAGSSLAKKLNCELFFDHSFFMGKSRPYEMGVFGVKNKACRDLRPLLYWKMRKVLKNTKNFMGLDVYHEESFLWEKRFSEIRDNTFIEGFFQSCKYFDTEVANSLSFKAPVEKKNLEFVLKMQDENSVSLHIRLGDYVKKQRYANVYHHLDFEYYKKAIELIKNSVSNPVFYVFSDDPEGARSILKLDNCDYVSHNTGKNSWQDMFLMSNCKHNIIANSSFSYWGAQLNRNETKIVVAPKLWFQDPKKPTTDLYPATWQLI